MILTMKFPCEVVGRLVCGHMKWAEKAEQFGGDEQAVRSVPGQRLGVLLPQVLALR